MKKILFPTDFSETAQNAYIYALHIAAKLGASIESFHTYNIGIDGETGPSDTIKEIKEQEKLAKLEQHKTATQKMHEQAVTEELKSVNVTHVLEEGTVVDGILTVSKKGDFDLIIMGTTGASGLKEWFFGSNTAKVIQQSDKPLLVVPKEARFKGIKKIAYGCDLSEASQQGLQKVLQFASLFDVEVHCIHINLDSDKLGEKTIAMDALKSCCGDTRNLICEVINRSDVEEGLGDYIKENDIDMISVLNQKTSLIERLLSGSYTKKMTFHTKIPLLVFKKNVL